jgi:KTSC domain
MKVICMFAFIALFPLLAQSAERETAAIVSRIPRQPVVSTALASVGYSKRLHVLEIEFANGAIYRYADVPPSVYRDLLSAASKARYYDTNIKGNYPSVLVRSRSKEAANR